MIKYRLKCDDGHVFEAWFGNAAAYDDQAARGLVSCSICGSQKIEKTLMAPGVPAKGDAKEPPAGQMLSGPAPEEVRRKLAELRREIEKNSRYVGRDFAREARAMHVGEIDHAPIHGEASGEEAKSLIEDGVPVAPLPFFPRRDD